MAYKKVGGLHFFLLGRFGITFYIKRNRLPLAAGAIERAAKRKITLAALRGDQMADYDRRFGYRLNQMEFPELYLPKVTSGGNS